MSFTGLLGDWLRKINASITSLSINGPTVTYNKHDGTVGTETINLDSTYAKLTGNLANDIITRTSPSGRIAQFMSYGGSVASDNEILDIGWNYANRDGAVLGLRSASHPTQAGNFHLRADDGNNTSVLIGKPDGDLKWNSKSLINNGEFNKMFFSQTSGSYTAPYTGVYRITLKGGGGGGGGAQTDIYATGGGGGEGGKITFYVTLIKNQSYPYTIGAGGAAGANGAGGTVATNGANGGQTTWNSSYTVEGGIGGQRRFSGGWGGRGGASATVPSEVVAYLDMGAKGENGNYIPSAGYYVGVTPNGGGAGVNRNGYSTNNGGGGMGGGPNVFDKTTALEPTTGGNGYILIEFAS